YKKQATLHGRSGSKRRNGARYPPPRPTDPGWVPGRGPRHCGTVPAGGRFARMAEQVEVDVLGTGFDAMGTLAQRMGIEIVEASAARVVGTMPVDGNTQPLGLLHGGASC